MRYHETAANSKVSHTTVKTSVDSANKLQEATAQSLLNLIESVIPEEMEKTPPNVFSDYRKGWNACREDIKSKLIGGSNGTK